MAVVFALKVNIGVARIVANNDKETWLVPPVSKRIGLAKQMPETAELGAVDDAETAWRPCLFQTSDQI